MIKNILCFLKLHKWSIIKRSSIQPNPKRYCEWCHKSELYVYGIGWMDVIKSEIYEPE